MAFQEEPCFISCAEPWEQSANMFFGSADYEAFVRVVKEALLIVPMRILGYCLMPNHFRSVA